MLTEKQMSEIKEHLEKAQNPLFFYDNDADGLCSFLILRKYIGRGKGVAIRSYPALDGSYSRKASELKADYVFVLDKPLIKKEFFEEIYKMQLPLVWIDHHDVETENVDNFNNVYIYNVNKNQGKYKSSEPVTHICYSISKKKEDLWLAVIGCVSDHFMPEFAEEFGEKYPELWAKGIKEPFDVYYKTGIGEIARAFNFGIKDSTTNIVRMQNFLITCKSPSDVLSESKENYSFRKKISEIEKKYKSILKRAKENSGKKLLFFEYSGTISISSEVSNELSYIYKNKYIAVAYKNGSVYNISLRGKNVKKILEEILKKMEHASGGGHEDAVGAKIKSEDLDKFKIFLEQEIEKFK